jgi:hypothetical protein
LLVFFIFVHLLKHSFYLKYFRPILRRGPDDYFTLGEDDDDDEEDDSTKPSTKEGKRGKLPSQQGKLPSQPQNVDAPSTSADDPLAGWAGLHPTSNPLPAERSSIMSSLSKTPPTPPQRFIEESTTHQSSWFNASHKLLSFSTFGKCKPKTQTEDPAESEPLLPDQETAL